jgi:hypothetical protein
MSVKRRRATSPRVTRRAPHQRAVRAAAKEMAYTSEETFRSQLEQAQRLFPEIVRACRGRGAVWIQSG